MSNLRTGGQVIADHLAANGVPYVVGIPGHGSLPMVDAFRDRQGPTFLQVRHEQSAAHLADAYFRVGRKPLAVMTSIGPGAVNTAVGIATAYVDSSSMLVFTGDVHTYMFGRGVLQEVDRKAWADLVSIFEPITKRQWQVTPRGPAGAGHAAGVRAGHRRTARSGAGLGAHGRPGGRGRRRGGARGGHAAPPAPPAAAVATIEPPWRTPNVCRSSSPAAASYRAGAAPRFRGSPEHLGIPVVATYQGKGVLPEDHPLYGWYPGSKGTDTGNTLCREADVILAIGCRFADEATSSYVPGVTFSIPPTRLYQVDIDEYELGKNYPSTGSWRTPRPSVTRSGPSCATSQRTWPGDARRRGAASPASMGLWNARTGAGRTDRALPLRISALLDVAARRAPAGHHRGHRRRPSPGPVPPGVPRQRAARASRSNGFSTMGFTIPGALGAKLAAPDRPVSASPGTATS